MGVQLDARLWVVRAGDARAPRVGSADSIEPVAVSHAAIKKCATARAPLKAAPVPLIEVNVNRFVAVHDARLCNNRVGSLLPLLTVFCRRAVWPDQLEMELAVRGASPVLQLVQSAEIV